MRETRQYDAIVVGSGQGGGPLSTALAAAGRRTAMIEREYVGGTCINTGCTPTKTMIASARVAYLEGRSQEYGVNTGPESVDMHAVLRRKREVVRSFRENSERRIREGGVDLIRGEARFTGPKSLEVRLNDGGPLAVSANEFFIDTGTRPADFPIDGLDGVPHLDSTSILELEELPEHLLVLGGGYIGLEFGQMFRRFGSRVTIMERGSKFLAREDGDIAAAIAGIMRDDGIDVYLEAAAQHVEQHDGAIRLSITCPDGEHVIGGSHLLIAVGRVPNCESLNLPAAGIETTARGFIKVDERLQTTAPDIWALGEIAGSPAFTHISYDDFRIIRDNLLHNGNRTTTDRLVPYTVFIDPQLGRVGMSETEARKAGRDIKVSTVPMSDVARAVEVDEQRGLVKAVVDADTDEILGAAVLGLEGGEIMAMFEIAMMGKLPYTALKNGIFAHPTLAEVMNTVFSSL